MEPNPTSGRLRQEPVLRLKVERALCYLRKNPHQQSTPSIGEAQRTTADDKPRQRGQLTLTNKQNYRARNSARPIQWVIQHPRESLCIQGLNANAAGRRALQDMPSMPKAKLAGQGVNNCIRARLGGPCTQPEL